MEIHRQAAAAIPRVEMTVLLMKEGSDSQVPVRRIPALEGLPEMHADAR